MQVGQARQRRPAARSAWGCTSSCRSRADRSACRPTCSASRGSTKCRTTSGSASSGSGGGAAASASAGSSSPSGRSRHVARRQIARPRRPGLESSNSSCVARVFRMSRVSILRRRSRVRGHDVQARRPAGRSRALRPLLGHGHQEAVGQFRIPPAQRHAGEDARVAAACASNSSTRPSGTRTTNSLNVGPVERQRRTGRRPSAARRRSAPFAGTARPPRAGPAGPSPPGRPSARSANSPWFVQMLLVAFSRRMCCSRVCSVSTQQRLPRRSTVWPTSRPGMRRTNCSRQAMMPRYGPPNGHRVAQRLPFGHDDVGPVVARPLQQAQADRIDRRRPTAPRPRWAISASRVHLFQAAEEVRMLHQHAGRLVVDRRCQLGRARSCRRACRRVTSSAPRLARYVASIWRYSGWTLAGDDHAAAAPVALHRHQHRLGRGAAAVVEAGIRDVHAGQLRDQRLILEQRLQVALAGLGLIGRVGGVELAPRRRRSRPPRE